MKSSAPLSSAVIFTASSLAVIMSTGRARVALLVPQAAADLDAVHARHHHVEHHQVGPLPGHRPQGLLAGRDRAHPVAPRDEDRLEQADVGRRVVDHQDLAGVVAQGASPDEPAARRRT